MAINIKFTKFDNTAWGFRLAGGSDFPQPLTVIKVNEESLAECMGIKVGDVVVRLNDQPISGLTHGQAHEALKLAGNNFVLGVQREGEGSRKALEGISDENIVPYNIPLADLPPVFPERILSEETVLEQREIPIERLPTPEKVEELPDKPKDANSEIIPNQNLTDEEIAQLILEEEELLPDKGVLGVNFKKLRPRATALRDSKVLEELQNIATAPPPDIEERHHVSTFLQKPNRPIPKAKPREPDEGEPYRVVIKKQSKKSVIARLVEKGLIPPGSLDTPEPTSEATTPAGTPDLTGRSSGAKTPNSRPESKLEVLERTQDVTTEKIEEVTIEGKDPNVRLEDLQEKKTVEIEVEKVEEKEEERKEEKEKEQEQKQKEEEEEKEEEKQSRREEPILAGIERQMAEVASKVDREKIKELVRTEINLEKQLENVQSQLLALKQLPSEIENHLRVVSEQLRVIMELSGVQNGGSTVSSRRGSAEEEAAATNQCPRERKEESPPRTEDVKENTKEEYDVRSERPSTAMSQEPPQIIEPAEDDEEEIETRELDGTISVKSSDDEGGSRVKKFVVSYETRVSRSRTASPTPSYVQERKKTFARSLAPG
ncbi:PREDICTED: DNA ligase 1-like isoform X4 [Polistes dominula]|uniref:DNA ligase 1-like isoform X4 n=1 Tax=Polistes dominula TaxID=743375 RepID=A0ABM1IEX8_POLDO|nr:PREDICTED: DNA ligase 1-like isoform X4 [Polistes dominula]